VIYGLFKTLNHLCEFLKATNNLWTFKETPKKLSNLWTFQRSRVICEPPKKPSNFESSKKPSNFESLKKLMKIMDCQIDYIFRALEERSLMCLANSTKPDSLIFLIQGVKMRTILIKV